MSYNQNIPQPTQRLKDSQPQLLANFQALYDFLNVNHSIFGTGGSLEGKHKWISFPNQLASPPTGSNFLAGEQGLYNFIYPTTTKNELYVHKQATLGLTEVPMTASSLSAGGAPSGSGWTYLPSGTLLMWYPVSAGPNPVNYVTAKPAGFPAINITGVQASIAQNSTTPDVAVTIIDNSDFLRFSQRTTTTPVTSGCRAYIFLTGY